MALTTFADLVQTVKERIGTGRQGGGLRRRDGRSLEEGGRGAPAYAEAVAVYLGLTSSKAARFTTTLSTWRPDETKLSRAFARNDIPMTWDFAETKSIFGYPAVTSLGWQMEPLRFWRTFRPVLRVLPSPGRRRGTRTIVCSSRRIDRSSVLRQHWLRGPLRLSSTCGCAARLKRCCQACSLRWRSKDGGVVATPFIATAGKKQAEVFFLTGMTRAMHGIVRSAHPAFPVTILLRVQAGREQGDEGTRAPVGRHFWTL